MNSICEISPVINLTSPVLENLVRDLSEGFHFTCDHSFIVYLSLIPQLYLT
jgi:hypothetical protein